MPDTDRKIKSQDNTEKTTHNTRKISGKRTRLDYVEMAKERNARVILHNTPDTYPLTEMARYADQSIRRLRNRIMISLAPSEALPLLDEYNDALLGLHAVVTKICDLTNVRYQAPRALRTQVLKGESANKSD